MKKYNSGVDYLTNEIQEIENEYYLNNNKNKLNKKYIIYIAIPISILSLYLISTKIPISLYICLVGSSYIITNNSIQILKNIITKKRLSQDNEFIKRKKNMYYLNDEYKDLILNSSYETEDERKFRETIQTQQKINLKNNYLNKDETIKQIVYEIDLFYDAYELSSLEITNNEWDIYFDNTYKLFVNKHLEKYFYKNMQSVIRLILAKSLVMENEEITAKDFIDGLKYLSLNKEISTNEIKELQYKLNNKLKTNKIININDYKRKLKR